MKKWITRLVCFSLIMVLFGCQASKKPSDDGEVIKMSVYTLNTCSNCKAFKEYAIPALEAEFGKQIEITILDLDEEGIGEQYDQTTAKLENYDMTYSRLVPFIVIEDAFAVLAYNKGEETALISDIKAYQENQPLGNTLAQGRWLFKK